MTDYRLASDHTHDGCRQWGQATISRRDTRAGPHGRNVGRCVCRQAAMACLKHVADQAQSNRPRLYGSHLDHWICADRPCCRFHSLSFWEKAGVRASGAGLRRIHCSVASQQKNAPSRFQKTGFRTSDLAGVSGAAWSCASAGTTAGAGRARVQQPQPPQQVRWRIGGPVPVLRWLQGQARRHPQVQQQVP